MAHFELPLDSTITLTSPSFAPLPINTPVGVADLLRSYVELSQPATRRSLNILIKHTSDEDVKTELSKIANDDSLFQAKISGPRTPVFDLLAKHPDIQLPLPTFISLLLPLSVRQYSISSSPLANADTCTLTFSVLSSATQKHPFNPDQVKIQNRTENEDNIFYGVATNYLASLKIGDRIQCSVRKTAKSTFRLPLDTEKTPLLMFCAGTGLAPFRGFLQQRAVQKRANPDVKLAPAAIFIGCRSATRDRLYAQELEDWSKLGVVQLKYAFSEEPEHELAEGCKRVGERMIQEKVLMQHLWREGARVYVCGSRGVADDVRKAADQIIQGIYEKKKAAGEPMTPEDLKTVKERIQQRSANDIFD
jgi:cytochrome P450 / NADPH-cytochrome P450 reductase